MFSVRVISKSTGNPIKGKRVRVGFDGLRGMTGEAYTDSNGDVHFDAKPGTGTVYVDHKTAYKGKIEGRIVIYL